MGAFSDNASFRIQFSVAQAGKLSFDEFERPEGILIRTIDDERGVI